MDITNMLNGKSQQQRQYQQQMAQNVNYPSPTSNTSPTDLHHPMSMLAPGYGERPYESGYIPQQQGEHKTAGSMSNAPRSGSDGNVKSFACTTCGKGFARRSDLARHGRNRPRGMYPTRAYVVQQSGYIAPFSDSSSLARHRRIHSGKRPYKCPFADCQKTFTRRTTLTRHQNHHTGTVEEAAAATAAALATRTPGARDRTGSDGSNYTEAASIASATTRTPSPGERHDSLSPNTDVPQMPFLNRQSGHMNYAPHNEPLPPFNDSLPPHLRAGLQQPSPRSSPSASSPSLSAFGGSNHFHRPSLTSHPILPVLEPPTYHDLRQPGSGSGSPHLGTPGWNSPVHQPVHQSGLPSPGQCDSGFSYPEPMFPTGQHLYYPNSNMRRPQSTEPDQYELKPRLTSNGGVWATSMG
ncbi:hypothetical protein ACLMJK_005457 [Lecanora helva]